MRQMQKAMLEVERLSRRKEALDDEAQMLTYWSREFGFSDVIVLLLYVFFC